MPARKHPTIKQFLCESAGRPGCWEWPGKRHEHGYGIVCENGEQIRAHRAAYRAAVGPLEDGVPLLHSCDNRPCCRPDHLSPGTAKANYEDARSRDRHARGERHGQAKLTDEQVRAIRADTRTTRVIAAEYRISNGVVSMIRNRRIWRHVQEEQAQC